MGNAGVKDLFGVGNDVERVINWSELNQLQQIEYQLPFHTMTWEAYELRLKRYTFSKTTVLITQLKEAFKQDPKWVIALDDENSALAMLLEYFRDEDYKPDKHLDP